MHKILWDFDIKTDYPVPTERPSLDLVYKKKRTLGNFRI